MPQFGDPPERDLNPPEFYEDPPDEDDDEKPVSDPYDPGENYCPEHLRQCRGGEDGPYG